MGALEEISQEAEICSILIAEDNTLAADIEKSFYLNSGFIVFTAKTSKEIEKIITQNKIDILLIDISFQKKHTESILQNLKSFDSMKNTKIVLTSVQALSPQQKKSIKPLVHLHIKKPAPRNAILGEIKQLLEKQIRDKERIEHHAQVSFQYEGIAFQSTTLDISSDGLHLKKCKAPLKEGDLLEIHLELPLDKIIKIQTTVVRKTKEGWGLRFQKLNRKDQSILGLFLMEHSLENKNSYYYLD